MAEDLTREQVLEILRRDNPRAPAQALCTYADAFMQYQKAAANIRELGAVVAHPRTGQPIENPYVKAQQQALRAFNSIKARLRTDALWQPNG